MSLSELTAHPAVCCLVPPAGKSVCAHTCSHLPNYPPLYKYIYCISLVLLSSCHIVYVFIAKLCRHLFAWSASCLPPPRWKSTWLCCSSLTTVVVVQVVNSCSQSDIWVCCRPLRLNHTPVLCSLLAAAFLQRMMSGTIIPAHKAISVWSDLNGAAECRPVILYLLESLRYSTISSSFVNHCSIINVLPTLWIDVYAKWVNVMCQITVHGGITCIQQSACVFWDIKSICRVGGVNITLQL